MRVCVNVWGGWVGGWVGGVNGWGGWVDDGDGNEYSRRDKVV